MSDRALVELRCSAIVFRGEAVLLLGRRRNGTRDWVLPGGHPRPREGRATCTYREVLEETGLDVQVGRVAFVLETTARACGQPLPTSATSGANRPMAPSTAAEGDRGG